MARILICEFMDEVAVATLARHHDTLYDPGLVDRRSELKAKLVPDLAESSEFTRLLTRSWTRFKTGQ